ncbi:MAG: hypothetical protein FWH42_04600 [Dehalococcoidia bacterium]|nr:hypothetical protein [Dehalococcoidia bacterium]
MIAAVYLGFWWFRQIYTLILWMCCSNIVISIVFAIIQIVKTKHRKSNIGYIGCCIGLGLSLVVPLISFIKGYGRVPSEYYFIEHGPIPWKVMLNRTFISCFIPTLFLLVISVISNFRHRKKTTISCKGI